MTLFLVFQFDWRGEDLALSANPSCGIITYFPRKYGGPLWNGFCLLDALRSIAKYHREEPYRYTMMGGKHIKWS